LINVFQVAEALGARAVQFAEPHPFFLGERAGNFDLIWDSAPSPLPTLEGEFFNARTFRLEQTASGVARVFAELVRPMLARPLRTPDPRVVGSDLVLHFRAGDVFRQSKLPHPGYGQPPLSFYLTVVEREQPARVWLVYEDRSNPCIEATEVALKARGVEVLMQSATLTEDLQVMLSATRMASGRGSFGEMIAHLSGRLRRAYFFERGGSVHALQHLGVEVTVARDANGEFKSKLLSNNWVASSEQRTLLLSYPAEKLSFEVRPYLHERIATSAT